MKTEKVAFVLMTFNIRLIPGWLADLWLRTVTLVLIPPITINFGWKPSIRLGFFPSHA